MSECRWDCAQDLNALAELGRDGWRPSNGVTQRGFWLTDFRDTYGQSCSIQQSSSVNPRVWVGVDCCRMHLSPAQARGLAARLIAFADAEEADDEQWACVECGAVDGDHVRDDGLPPGWQENDDGEPFCGDCLKRVPLDPPTTDE